MWGRGCLEQWEGQGRYHFWKQSVMCQARFLIFRLKRVLDVTWHHRQQSTLTQFAIKRCHFCFLHNTWENAMLAWLSKYLGYTPVAERHHSEDLGSGRHSWLGQLWLFLTTGLRSPHSAHFPSEGAPAVPLPHGEKRYPNHDRKLSLASFHFLLMPVKPLR